MGVAIVHYAARPAQADTAWEDVALARLAVGHRERVSSLPPVARSESLRALALLDLCALAAGLAPPLPASIDAPSGAKPTWRAGRDFSVAHAGGYVACALAPAGVTIGVDIELERAVAPADLRLWLTAEERALLDRGQVTAAMLWTSREATLKAAGQGLRAVGKVSVSGSGTAAIGGTTFTLHSVAVDGLRLTVACSQPTGIEIHRHIW